MASIVFSDCSACDPCSCICPTVTLMVDTVSATKNKCGLYSAGAYYLLCTYNLNSFIVGSPYVDSSCTSNLPSSITVTETVTVNPTTGACSSPVLANSTNSAVFTDTFPDDSFTPGGATCTASVTWDVVANDVDSCVNLGGAINGALPNTFPPWSCTGPAAAQATTIIGEYGGCGLYGCDQSTLVYSDEYTDAMLISYTEAALPAFSGVFVSSSVPCIVAEYNLSGNSLTIEQSQYYFTFSTPPPACGACFKISWNEGSTAKSYTWDGSATQTPTYTVNYPTSNETIQITDVTTTCTGC